LEMTSSSTGQTFETPKPAERRQEQIEPVVVPQHEHIDAFQLTELCTQANGFVQGKDFDKAITICSKIIQQTPNDAQSHRIRAKARNSKGDYEGAITDSFTDILFDHQSVDAYLTRAAHFRFRGDLAKAASDHKEAEGIKPNNQAIKKELGAIQLDSG